MQHHLRLSRFLTAGLKNALTIAVPAGLALAVAAALFDASFAPQARASRGTNVVGPPHAVASLAQLWVESPVVAFGKPDAPLAPQLDGEKIGRFRFFDIEEVLKDDDGVLHGARHIRIKDAEEPFLPTAHPAVLFLRPVRGGAFAIWNGRIGCFAVKDMNRQTIRVSQPASQLVELAGRHEISRSELLGILHSFRRGTEFGTAPFTR